MVDGLGRPVPGVTVKLLFSPKGQEKAPDMVLRTGNDGRFSGLNSSGDDTPLISFEKDGYGGYTTGFSSDREFTMNRGFDWD